MKAPPEGQDVICAAYRPCLSSGVQPSGPRKRWFGKRARNGGPLGPLAALDSEERLRIVRVA